jgi:hypothetical protein
MTRRLLLLVVLSATGCSPAPDPAAPASAAPDSSRVQPLRTLEPRMIPCNGVERVDTLWVDGVPYLERITVCGARP